VLTATVTAAPAAVHTATAAGPARPGGPSAGNRPPRSISTVETRKPMDHPMDDPITTRRTGSGRAAADPPQADR
jgi:hypothetical protein